MFEQKILALYKKNIFTRFDELDYLYYFSEKDFEGLKSENYEFYSYKGHILKGKFYYYDNFKPNHIVIFEHGMGGGHLSYFKEIEILCRNGFKVLSYDHTGCMESGGENSGGFSQSLADLIDLLNSLKSDKKFANMSFSVVGHSWGGFSTMNIPAFHNDIKHIIAISGFLSVDNIVKQTLGKFSKKSCGFAIELDNQSNPKLCNVNSIDSLSNFKGRALIIHSNDDKVVMPKYHFNILEKYLKNKTNIEFLLVNNKKHNPNYTEEAVQLKDKFFKQLKKDFKKGKLNSKEDRINYKKNVNWDKITEQDINIWNRIIEVLNYDVV